MSDQLSLVANVSLLFAELPFLDRFRAAAAQGFRRVESWWPFGSAPVPDEREIAAFLDSIVVAGLVHTGMNLFAGDMAAGERGVISHPDRQEEFAASLEVTASIASRTGCKGFNALYGQRVEGFDPAEQDEIAVRNLSMAAERLGEFGGVLFIEPLAHGLNGAYPIETAEQAAAVVARVRGETGADNVAMLFDTFHLASNGVDLAETARRWAPVIGHVQFADAPGRGAPGTGEIDFPVVLDTLWDAGYRGLVAAEYIPGPDTPASLSWIPWMPHMAHG